MKVLITGSLGMIGKAVARQLLQNGHQLICCGRNREHLIAAFPNAEAISIDFSAQLTPQMWLPRLHEVDVVVNAVGIFRESRTARFEQIHHQSAVALFQACELAGVQRVIQISSLGADETANTEYHKSKYRADSYLKNTRLDWAILHPSLVYAPVSPSLTFFRTLAALPFTPLPDSGSQKIQPISLEDVTHAIAWLIEAPSPVRATLPLVGPNAVSLRQFLTLQRRWLGFSEPRFVHVPSRPLETALRWLEPVIRTFYSGLISADSIRMLKRDNIASSEAFYDRFGWQATPLETSLNQQPASTADRWYYPLKGLKPLLLVSLSMLWVFTGWTSLWGHPQADSLSLLNRVGVPESWQLLTLYAAASADILLGIALLIKRYQRQALMAQLLLMSAYSLILIILLPEYWLHPFGPVTKNLPLTIVTLMLLAMSKEDR